MLSTSEALMSLSLVSVLIRAWPESMEFKTPLLQIVNKSVLIIFNDTDIMNSHVGFVTQSSPLLLQMLDELFSI